MQEKELNFDETWAVPAEDLDATWPIAPRVTHAGPSSRIPQPQQPRAEVARSEPALGERA